MSFAEVAQTHWLPVSTMPAPDQQPACLPCMLHPETANIDTHAPVALIHHIRALDQPPVAHNVSSARAVAVARQAGRRGAQEADARDKALQVLLRLHRVDLARVGANLVWERGQGGQTCAASGI